MTRNLGGLVIIMKGLATGVLIQDVSELYKNLIIFHYNCYPASMFNYKNGREKN